MQLPDPPPSRRNLLQTSLYFASMIGFLVFSDWASPSKAVVPLKENVVAVAAKGTRVNLPEGANLEVEHYRGGRRAIHGGVAGAHCRAGSEDQSRSWPRPTFRWMPSAAATPARFSR